MNDEDRLDDDAARGLGLIEVVVAMMLLALIAVSVLPVMINSLKLSATNVSLTTATQLVNEQMDSARGLASTCAAVQNFAADQLGLRVTDPKGRVLVIHRETVASCPAGYPSALIFKAWITTETGSQRLAEAETRIYVASAS